MTIRPEEITGETGVFTRVLEALNQRTAQLPENAKPSFVFLGYRERAELESIAKTWGHAWPSPDGQRPKIFDTPIYIVDAESFIAVL